MSYTIYINNINERVKLPRLKTTLIKQFGHYGKIIQVTAHHNFRMKGQAFITYSSAEAASKAIKEMNGKKIYKKHIRVAMAQLESDLYYKEIKGDEKSIEERKLKKQQRSEQEANKQSQGNSKSEDTKSKRNKERHLDGNYWNSLPPHHTLLIQNLNINEGNEDNIQNDLEEFFEQYNGFNKVRLIKVRKLTFIEFDDQVLATTCLKSARTEELQQQFGDEIMISFAKK